VSVVTATVDVAVPVRTAYNHWTRVEELPTFFGEFEQAGIPSNRLNDYLRPFRDFGQGHDSGANQ
jgi:hypothetical protein